MLPTRKDRGWEIELAPLTRLQAWRVAEIKPGAQVSVLGFTNAVVQPVTEVLQDGGSELVECAYGAKPEDLGAIAKDSAEGGLGMTPAAGSVRLHGAPQQQQARRVQINGRSILTAVSALVI